MGKEKNMQVGIVLQSGETWPKMSSDKLRPAGNPYNTEKTGDYSKWRQDGW